MGSPLLLRPLKAQDGKSVPVVVLLNAPAPEKLELKRTASTAGTAKTFGADDIVNPKFSNYPKAPMKDRSSRGSAIEAFAAYLKEKEWGFREVGR
jgi:CRISPR-associated protein Cmr1